MFFCLSVIMHPVYSNRHQCVGLVFAPLLCSLPVDVLLQGASAGQPALPCLILELVLTSQTTSTALLSTCHLGSLIRPSISRSSSSCLVPALSPFLALYKAWWCLRSVSSLPVCPEIVTQFRGRVLFFSGPTIAISSPPCLPLRPTLPRRKNSLSPSGYERTQLWLFNCFHIFCIPAPDKGPASFTPSCFHSFNLF